MKLRRFGLGVLSSALLWIGCTPPNPQVTPPAQIAPVHFYEGKTIHLYIGFSSPSEPDRAARLIFDHMSPHIPGRPRVIVSNMPGAESIISANYLYNVAKPDGLTVGAFAGDPALWKDAAAKGRIKFEPRKFQWIGGIEDGATKRRLFLSLPPGTPERLAEILRIAFLNSIKSPPVLAGLGRTIIPMTSKEVETIVNEFSKEPGIGPR